MTAKPNPLVDKAITQAMRQINTAASCADQTCDPRAHDLHTLSERLQFLLLAAPSAADQGQPS